MAITLFVKKPFVIDRTLTLITQDIYIDGGSILNILDDRIYTNHKRAALEAPFLTNYIYYHIYDKDYIVSDDSELENIEQKLLFKVVKNTSGIITDIFNMFNDESMTDLDNLPGSGTVDEQSASAVTNDQNIEIPYETGNIIPLSKQVVSVISINIYYENNGTLTSFGPLDLDNIKTLNTTTIELNYNLVKAVSKKLRLSTMLDKIFVDVVYTY